MKSIPLALSWEFWGRDKKAVPLTLGIGVSLTLLCYYGLLPLSPEQTAEVTTVFHALLFTAIMPIVVLAVSVLVGVPETRFTLPISTWSLVGWPMVNGCVASAAGYLLLAVFANTCIDADWPLLKPLLAAVCIYALSHCLSWISECGPLRSLIGIVSTACLTVTTTWLHLHSLNHDAEPYWQQKLTAGEMLLAVVLIGVAYVAAVGGVSLSRRGQPLSLTKLGQFLVDRLDFHPQPRHVFDSARSAQSWFEWTSKGIAVPAVGGFAGLCVCILFSTGRLFPWETAETIGVVTYMILMVSPLLGWFLGNAGPKFNVHEFTATRPMTDTELADLTLVNAAKSMCLGWLVWWIGAGLALGCAVLSGTAPTTAAQFFELNVPPETWSQAGLYFAALVGCCLLACWTLISLGVSTVLLRPWLFATISYVVFFCVISIPLIGSSPLAAATLIPLIGILIVSSTVFVYVAAYRLGLIGKTRIVVNGCLFLVLSTCAFVVLPRVPDVNTASLCLLLTACLSPFIAPAATPLAFWWNRHR